MRTVRDRLRARDRELLLLKYTEGWTCRELSERLGIPVSTAESRLDRARMNLREELASRPAAEPGSAEALRRVLYDDEQRYVAQRRSIRHGVKS